MTIWVWLIVLIPVSTGLFTWLIQKQKISEWIHLVGSFLLLLAGLKVSFEAFFYQPIQMAKDYIYIDALSGFLMLIIVIVGFTSAVYSVGYMREEYNEGVITEKQLYRYYLWYHLFIFSMIMVSLMNNIGFLWISIEATTLISALLVAFYHKGASLEAAWKYLIIGSVGIAFALLGIIFVYATGVDVLGEEYGALNWTVLNQVASQLNPSWMTFAFIFVLVGFGTKAGLAPMHFWLPDAHSQAPSPVSAVLSGVLLNTALYGIVRIYLIMNQSVGESANQWLIGLGLFSVAIIVPFILVQHDYKRMLAYSSVEHIGIISLGIGIGGSLGLYGAMLHMFNHSMTKTMLFLAAGNINQKYHSKRIDRVTGVIKVMPITGTIFLIGAFAIAGAPPFNIFISELTIIIAGFKEQQILYSILLLCCIVLIFAGITYYVTKMVFGLVKNNVKMGEVNRWSTAALFIPLIFVIVFGVYIPPFFQQILENVVVVLQGGR